MKRRGPEPGRADFARWRRLIAEAEASAAAPGGPAGDLAAAELTARRQAVVPWGELSKANPFVRLVRLAQQFVGETAAGRRALAPELGAAAATCRPLLEAAAEPPAQTARLPFKED